MSAHPASLRRSLLPLVLGGAVLGVAPAAAAQRFVAATGDPIAYRVDVPAGARIEHDGYFMTAEAGNAYVVAAAIDLVTEAESPLPVSDQEARRIMTNVFLGSDSLLLGLIDEGMRRRNVRLEDMVREIRTLGGQRAGYVRGRIDRDPGAPWLETYVTVKDGVMYMLVFGAIGSPAQVERIAARIHESFVLPDAPPVALPAPAPRTGALRRIEKAP